MSNSSTKEKAVRVFELAKELNVESKLLLDYCKELGYSDVKNQLKGLTGDQVDALKDRSKKGPKVSTPAAPLPTAIKPTLPTKIDAKIHTIPKAKPVVRPVEQPDVSEPEPEPVAEPQAVAPPVETVAPPAAEPEAVSPPPPPAAPVLPKLPTFGGSKIQNLSAKPTPKPQPPKPVEQPPAVAPTPPAAEQPAPAATTPAAPSVPPPVAATAPPVRPTLPPTMPRPGVPTLGGSTGRPAPQVGPPRPITTTGGPPQQRPGPGQPPRPPQAGGPRPIGSNMNRGPGGPPPGGPPKPHTGKGPPQVGPPRAPAGPTKLTPEMLEKIRNLAKQGKRVDIKEIHKTGEVTTTGAPGGGDRGPGRGPDAPRTGGPTRPPLPRPQGAGTGGDDDEKPKGPGGGGGAGVIGRDARHKSRQDRGRHGGGSTDRNSVVIGAGGSVDIIEEKHGSRRGPRAALLSKMRRRQQQQVVKKEGPVEIAPPITVRSLSEAIGMKVGELGKRLVKETNKLYSVNSPVEFEVAELIAIEKGIQLQLKKQMTAEDIVVAGYQKRAEEMDPALAVTRPPIVTIMGHVDHGKTTLLDKIRQEYGIKSDVVSTEAGGITQVIRAWQVEKDGNHVTFLDTPGHEAFTKMRARGAKVTDIVVIVVAATDGVMPQTEEAISHAKAADVSIIVAINKIDMPNANLDKTRRQLYQLELLPDNMGGDVPFVETSAVTGQGISELLEQVLLVAELADPPLKADPQHPGSGTCLEAYQDSDEGVKATLIVQQGTLHKGDVIFCGATFGRVRAMYNDLGVQIDEAGPSTPVKITGLDEVPDADDPFYVVEDEDLSKAREIAEAKKVSRQRASLSSFTPVSLDTFNAAKAAQKITELKVIVKAEARGSIEAIKKEMEKLVHEEVRARVLHAGIGAINESDVELALTSPSDTLVIGFNVTADDAALRLAEQRGISLREYDIIYKLTDDVKAALEGKLKPIEEVVHLGRAVIRDTFKISKVGTIAGCYVTSGVIERSARVRVIRQGVVIYPPSEKVVGLDSLKRFKDDAKDVREGFECGLKISGFDDVKVDDVIEAFKIEIRHRTL